MDSSAMCGVWIRRPENHNLVVLAKTRPSSVEIFSFDPKTTSLSPSPLACHVLDESDGDPVTIVVHPNGEDIVCSTSSGDCKCLELSGQESDVKLLPKELPSLKGVGHLNCVAFSVDGSRFAAGGIDGRLRIWEWPSLRVILDEPRAHKSVRDIDFSLDSEFLASTSTDGSARIWKAEDGVPLTTLTRKSDEKIELCRFSKDGTKPFLFCTVQKGDKPVTGVWDISTWNKIGHKRLLRKPASMMSISLDGKYLALGSKDGDFCVVEVKKMEISHWSKRLHLGSGISFLEFCPSERVVLTSSKEWGVMVTKLNVPADWKGLSLLQSEGSASDDSSSDEDRGRKGSQKNMKRRDREKEGVNDSASDFDYQKILRKEMGLEWMLRPSDGRSKSPIAVDNAESLEAPNEETVKINLRELNPYLKDGGSGYPEEEDATKSSGGNTLYSSMVGDGGASWRLKALKRAQEQAAREGRKVNEVVAERWGSLGELAVSVAAGGIAPSRAHLRAIKERRRGQTEDRRMPKIEDVEGDTRKNNRGYLKDVSLRHPEMRVPKVRDSLSWGKRRSQNMPSKDAAVISAAVSSLNKYSNDGSFMQEALRQSRDNASVSSSCEPPSNEPNLNGGNKLPEAIPELKEGLTANQMAAKAMQLRMKGKHDEAERLLQEVEKLKSRQLSDNLPQDVRNARPATRYDAKDRSAQRKKDDDADLHLARSIVQNKKFSISGRADDEYDYDGAPSKRSKKKPASRDTKVTQTMGRCFTTQQERCLFCFENPRRPKHLVVSIANFVYLMLPQHQPVVTGHCCIVTLQHESSTRTVDDDVWDEFRNFKKCLIMMFAKQEKEVVFLETVMGLAQQRRHCLIECVPLPDDIAKEAPLYFKKAIDEAEDEWSQHNAKKLIDTSTKGLRASIPKDFPYFHVEFGLNKGFVHVIEDEDRFKSGFGLNVIRGMLKLPEEDMHRRRRYESADVQKQSLAAFVRDWQAFNWTKQLD